MCDDRAVADPVLADPHAETLPSDPATARDREARDELIGRTLGHFRIDARLGRGGMGAVYRGWDASLEREVAVKVLLGASEASRERFLREARVQAKLRHPNVVPIHFVGQAEDFGAERRSPSEGELEGHEPLERRCVSFLVMDVVDGESLADLLAREGSLTEARALDVADAIASALEAGSSAGLVHRDVKPSNILVDKTGRVMLADFGLAKNVALDGEVEPHAAPTVSGTQNLTHAGAILGTPAYLAPEQARGEAVDFRADMYSLGVTLYEALAGQPPFTGETAAALLRQHVHEAPIAPRVLKPSLRPAVESLVMRLLDKRPEARFSSYAELRAAIAAARARELVPATFFVRAVALAVDLVALGVYAAVLLVLTKSATVAWLVPSLSFGALERVWSTPGKKLMRLRVVDPKGDPTSWPVMLTRSALRLFGPIAIAVESDLFGARGLFASPRLDGALTALSMLAWLVGLALGVGGRPLHDRILKTREVFV
jgi:eukaryotic-like serine/threonine-protein kinase